MGLDDVRTDRAMVQTPDGLRARGAELVGEVVRYEDLYRLCYLRGPAGIIVELAERITGDARSPQGSTV